MYYKVWNEIKKDTSEIRTLIQPLDRPVGEPQGNTLDINEQLLGEIMYTLFSKGVYPMLKVLEQNDLIKE